jgi:Calpain family cysteine protease
MRLDLGALGDCYFLASAAALSGDPERVKRLFVHDKVVNGVIGVKMFKDGEPVVIWVDDRFPMRDRRPFLAKPNNLDKQENHEVWLMALEKAYAKMNGNYGAIGSGGYGVVALNDLTGLPTTEKWLRDGAVSKGELWRFLADTKHDHKVISASIFVPPVWRYLACGTQKRFIRVTRGIKYYLYSIVSLCSPLRSAVDFLSQLFGCIFSYIRFAWYTVINFLDMITCRYISSTFMYVVELLSMMFVGLVPMHEYSVTGINNDGLTRLVKVKNPWGDQVRWRGWFRHGSICWWRCRLAALTGADKLGEESGEWWMSLGDFYEYFDHVTVCHLGSSSSNDNHASIRFEGVINSSQVLVPFTCKKNTNVRFQVHIARRAPSEGLNLCDSGIAYHVSIVREDGALVTAQAPSCFQQLCCGAEDKGTGVFHLFRAFLLTG